MLQIASLTLKGRQRSHKKKEQERQQRLCSNKLFLHIPEIHGGWRERNGERDTVCKASGIMNSYTCHMLLTDSWQLHFPPLSILLYFCQSPNLFSVSSSHSTYCTYPLLILLHHFRPPLFSLSLSLTYPTCLSIEYFKRNSVKLHSYNVELLSSRKSLGARLNLTHKIQHVRVLSLKSA